MNTSINDNLPPTKPSRGIEMMQCSIQVATTAGLFNVVILSETQCIIMYLNSSIGRLV